MNKKLSLVVLIMIIVIFVALFIFIRISVDSTRSRAKRRIRTDRSSYSQEDNIAKKEVRSTSRKFDVFKPEPKEVERYKEDELLGLEFENNKKGALLR